MNAFYSYRTLLYQSVEKRWPRRILLLLLYMLMGWRIVSAQPNVSRVEYYIDNDPGFGAATALSFTPAADVANLTIAVDPSTVTEGVHRLFVRAQDAAGKWSLTNTWLFYKPYGSTGTVPQPTPPANITRIEYYIDTDPGYGAATAMSITPGTDLADAIIALNPATVSEGVHRLFVRALNANGTWSMTNTWLFYKPYGSSGTVPQPNPVPNITLMEYYIDSDPGYGVATPISTTPGTDLADVIVSLNPATLSEGVHRFFVRAKDAYGTWSLTNTWIFYKPYGNAGALAAPIIAKLRKLEYYIDNDPGFGSGVPVALDSLTDFSDYVMPINVTGLSVGTHNLWVRGQDMQGKWSMMNKWLFSVSASIATPSIVFNSITRKANCARDSFSVSFDRTGTYNTGNQFKVELSDAIGSFASPVIIGSYTGTDNNIIKAVLPSHLPDGTLYRLRVSSTSPAVTGITGRDSITIHDRPFAQTITGLTQVNGTYTWPYTVPTTTGSAWNWLVNGGTQSSGGTTNSVNITWAQPATPAVAGKINVIETNQYGCVGDTSTLNLAIYKLRIGNTIAASACKGFGVTIGVNTDGAYYTGNNYVAQLSDASGSFTSPTVIGSTALAGNGVSQTATINAIIPQGIPNGTGYRVRVVSSTPAFTGDTSAAISILKPDVGADITRSKCTGFGYNLLQNYTDATLTYVYYMQAFGTLARPDSVDAGTYQVIASNSIGCKDTATVTVSNYNKPDLGADQSVSKCPGETVDLTNLFTTTGLTTSWNTSTPATQPVPGVYRLIVTNSNGCMDTAFVTVTNYVKPDLGPDKTVTISCAGSTYDLTTVFTTTGFTTGWNTTTPTAAIAGNYQLIVTSANGCKDTANVTVNATPITDVPSVANTKIANRECTGLDGWTHYYFDNGTPADYSDDMRLLSLKKNGQNIGTVGDGSFLVRVAATAGAGSNSAVVVNNSQLTATLYSMNRYWSVTTTQQPVTNVGVRFYYNSQDLTDVNGSYNAGVSHAGLKLYKTDGNPDPTTNLAGNTQLKLLTNGSTASATTWVYTSLDGNIHQAEFEVSSFSGGGAGASQGILPISLLRFTATGKDYTAFLNWTTSSEVNSRSFLVQRSLDGVNYTTVGNVNAAVQSTTQRSYDFTDKLSRILNGVTVVYYRLIMVDQSGDQKISPVATVKLGDAKSLLTLLYNPVQSDAVLHYQSTRTEPIAIWVIDATGRTVLQLSKSATTGGNQYRLPTATLAKGIYKIVLTSSGQPLTLSMMKE